MAKKKTTKKSNEYEVKKRIAEIGSELAGKMFPLQFNKPSINDVVERLVLLEGYKYGLLTEDESVAVRTYYGMPVENKKLVESPESVQKAISTIYPDKPLKPSTPLEAALGSFEND